jgi:hypothetical protein
VHVDPLRVVIWMPVSLVIASRSGGLVEQMPFESARDAERRQNCTQLRAARSHGCVKRKWRRQPRRAR